MHLDSTLTKFDQWKDQNQLTEAKSKMSKIEIDNWKIFKIFEKKILISKFSHLDYEKIESKIDKMTKIDRKEIYKIEIFYDLCLHDHGHKSRDLESQMNMIQRRS